MIPTKYEVQILRDNRWVTTGEKSNPLEAKRAARAFRMSGHKTRRLRVRRELMEEEEIR